ncbi:hypothetical protein [Pedobacter sp. R20-19]|uniref:hypothetical protein n=1 Tax=Pedobacter sp. R20-19 TaxID=1270196 RepID=UPI000A74700D|nr:hypothetical protein [Pedobacter sp. R20-19]
MRDKLKDKTYFDKQVSVFKDSIQEIESMIVSGKTAPDRVNFMKRIAIHSIL